MPFEYAPDVAPNTPYPLYLGWGLFADLHGQQAFQAPIKAFPGSAQAPGYSFDRDNRTGWYQPFANSLGASVAGFLRFYIDEGGTTYLNTLGFQGKLQTDALTANQTYQLPNASGTLALVPVGEYVIPVTKTTSYVIEPPDTRMVANHATVPVIFSLPPATGSGRILTMTNRGAAPAVAAGATTDKINNELTQTIPQWSTLKIHDVAVGIWIII